MATVTSDKTILGIEAGGAVVEGLAALAAVVVSILGIIGLVPLYMAPVAAILIGVAFGTYPANLAARLSPIDAIRHE